MDAREYVWTDAGRAKAAANGVALAEAVEALHAPKGLYYEREIGALLLIVMGMAESGRVIAVICDRIGGTEIYKIVTSHALGGADLDQWRDNVI